MKNNTELNETLRKITIALYIIIGVLVVNTLILVVCNNDKFTTSSNGSGSTNKTTTTAAGTTTYDVSSFKAITVDEFVNAYNGSDMQVVYFGRSTCGHCVTYVPVLKKVQQELGFTPLYLDITTVDSTSVEKLYALGDYFKENFGYTPMTVVVQNGQIVAEKIGAMDYDTLKSLLSPYISK